MRATVRIWGRDVPAALLVGVLVLANAAWIAYFGLRMHGLALYDEKFTVEGARWFHASFQRLWEVPSFGDRGIERLTALLFVPAIWLLGSTADQFVFNHLLMAVVFSLQAVPAYLLVRGLAVRVEWALVAAALAVFGPWAVFGSVFLNNAPAACAAAFALWAMWRAIVTPSARWDALALVFVGLAALARVSSAVLVVAFPVGILAWAITTRRWRDLRRHWLLAVVGLLGALWLVTGHAHTLVGHYPTTVDTTAGVVGNRLLTTVAHLSAGTGFVVAAIAIAWVVRQLVRPLSPEANAFAALALAYFAALSYVNLASGIDERYELMLFVPLTVAFVVALARREIALVPVAAAALLVWLALRRHGDIPFTQASDYLTWPSREWLSRVWLTKAEFDLGIGRATSLHLIGLATLAVALGLALLRGKWRNRLGIAVAAVVLLYAFAGSAWTMKKLSNTLRPQGSFAGVSFLDALTHGERVDPFGSTAEQNAAIPQMWSEVQYFNASVLHTISLEGPVYDLCCKPSGLDQVVTIDHPTGALSSDAPLPRWIATVPEWYPAGFATRLEFASSAYRPPVRLEKLRQPPSAAYISSGFDQYGWVRPRQPAQLRVYPAAAPGAPACLRMTLTAPTKLHGGTTHWIARVLGTSSGTDGALAQGETKRVDVPLQGERPIDLAIGASSRGPDPVTGAPGLIGVSDLRLVRCGAPDPEPRPAP